MPPTCADQSLLKIIQTIDFLSFLVFWDWPKQVKTDIFVLIRRPVLFQAPAARESSDSPVFLQG
jgi:hypothetical protein